MPNTYLLIAASLKTANIALSALPYFLGLRSILMNTATRVHLEFLFDESITRSNVHHLIAKDDRTRQ
jgi:hypothetical protein